jgi:hypothetical protein
MLVDATGKPTRYACMLPSFMQFKRPDGKQATLHFNADGTMKAGDDTSLEEILHIIAMMPADPKAFLTMVCLASAIRNQIERDAVMEYADNENDLVAN